MVVKIAGGGFPGFGSSGLMAVFSQHTGELSGILVDNGWLTDLRTAAAGALFARELATDSITAIGVLGTGVQARFQLELLASVLPCRKVERSTRHDEHTRFAYLESAVSISDLASRCIPRLGSASRGAFGQRDRPLPARMGAHRVSMHPLRPWSQP